jgi:hypothetical protein
MESCRLRKVLTSARLIFCESTDGSRLPRPRGAQRLEASGSKLGRRSSLYSRSAFDLWLYLDSKPVVQAFCKRPGFNPTKGGGHAKLRRPVAAACQACPAAQDAAWLAHPTLAVPSEQPLRLTGVRFLRDRVLQAARRAGIDPGAGRAQRADSANQARPHAATRQHRCTNTRPYLHVNYAHVRSIPP